MYKRLLSWCANQTGITLYKSYKQHYFSGIIGESILELGAGRGKNFQWYPSHAHVTVIEPNTRLHKTMLQRARKHNITLEIHSDPHLLESLADNSFDVVFDTLVLCSVPDASHTLYHISRVLKPNGTYYFLEHIIAPVGTLRYKAQNMFGPLWKFFMKDCDCTRPLDQYIIQQFPHAQYDYFIPTQLHHPLSNYLVIGNTQNTTCN